MKQISLAPSTELALVTISVAPFRLDLPRGPKRTGQGRGTKKINLTDPWLRKFPIEANYIDLDFSRRVPQMMRLPTLGLPPHRVFTLEEIDEATNNFDAANLMGEGSQGL
ncbi:unnamed protein product, partial [Prunus brigantina]